MLSFKISFQYSSPVRTVQNFNPSVSTESSVTRTEISKPAKVTTPQPETVQATPIPSVEPSIPFEVDRSTDTIKDLNGSVLYELKPDCDGLTILAFNDFNGDSIKELVVDVAEGCGNAMPWESSLLVLSEQGASGMKPVSKTHLCGGVVECNLSIQENFIKSEETVEAGTYTTLYTLSSDHTPIKVKEYDNIRPTVESIAELYPRKWNELVELKYDLNKDGTEEVITCAV